MNNGPDALWGNPNNMAFPCAPSEVDDKFLLCHPEEMRLGDLRHSSTSHSRPFMALLASFVVARPIRAVARSFEGLFDFVGKRNATGI
jgi:hypothetical protein